jgi:hypothetical protein
MDASEPDSGDGALSEELERKRAILFSTRIMFSPTAQSLREAAIHRIVELVLLFRTQRKRGLTLEQLHEEMHGALAGGLAPVTQGDVRKALRSLGDGGVVRGIGEGLAVRTYSLTRAGRRSIDSLEREATARFKRIGLSLFANVRGGTRRYLDPFISCIRRVFATLAESYVLLIKGDLEPAEFAALDAVTDAVEHVSAQYPDIESGILSRAVSRFLLEANPEFDLIKWNMTQNFYLMTALGMEQGSYLLSRELFDGASFYLDTNVIIAALLPRSTFHREYLELARSFKALGIKSKVCQITLNELHGVLDYERFRIEQTANQVPDESAPKIADRFFQAFRDAEARGAVDPMNDVFSPFQSPLDALQELGDVELVDDLWFVESERNAEVIRLVSDIQSVAHRLHPDRPKKDKAALHDAQLLLWVEKERDSDAEETWALTLDKALCGFEPDNAIADRPRTLGITLDTLLLWLAPVVATDGAVGEDVADIFSDALRFQLLPREKLLDLADFAIFSEIGWECRLLPAEDVEECIRYLKRQLPNTDPGKAEDRERVSAEIARFFADPARKYQANLNQLDGDLRAAQAEVKRVRLERVQEQANLERRLKIEAEDRLQKQQLKADEIEASLREQIDQLSGEVAELRDAAATEKDVARAKELRRQGKWRLIVAGLLTLALQAGTLLYTNAEGSGDTLLQRAISAWQLHVVVGAVSLFLAAWIVGKERLIALGWPFNKLLGQGDGS